MSEDTKTGLLLFVLMLAIGLGGGIAHSLIETEVFYEKTLSASQNLIYLSMLFFTICGFQLFGKKYPKIKAWAVNSVIAIICSVFVAGFVIVFFSNLYMLIPLPPWLHLTVSVILSLTACVCMISFYFSTNGR